MIRDRIVMGVWDDLVRKKLRVTRGLTMPKATEFCHAHEAASKHSEVMTSVDAVNVLHREQEWNQYR